jgi:hypothetical protein
MERPTRVRKQPSRLADFELGEDSGKLVRGGNGHVGRGGRGGHGRKVGGDLVPKQTIVFHVRGRVVSMGCRNG